VIVSAERRDVATCTPDYFFGPLKHSGYDMWHQGYNSESLHLAHRLLSSPPPPKILNYNILPSSE
jgi:hypothetical protein